MAIRISIVFGGNPEIWVRLQSSYDMRKAEKEFQAKKIKLERFEYAA